MHSSNWSFSRYLYLLVSVTTAGLVALFAIQYQARLDTNRRIADDATRGLARETAYRVNTALADSYRIAALIARRTVAIGADRSRCDVFLDEMLSVFPGFANLSVHDSDGRPVCSGQNASMLPEQPRKYLAFEQALQGQHALGEPVKINDRWAIIAAEPVFDEQKQVTAVLLLPLDLSWLAQLVRTGAGIPDSLITLTNADGIVLARSTLSSRWIGRDSRDVLPAADKFSGKAPVVESGLDGLRRIYGFAPVPEYGWRVYAGISEKALLSNARRDTALGLGIAATIILLILALAMVLARRITVPVNAMVNALRGNTNDGSPVPIPENGPAELTELARSFNDAVAARGKAESRLHGLIDSAMDAIVTINEKCEIVMVNPAAEKMFGYAAAELMGRSVNMLIPERFRSGHDRHVSDFAATGVTNRSMGQLGKITGRRSSGEEFPVEASISQLGASPDKLFTAILRDITRRQETEERVRRLNRVYAVLSGINTLIVRAQDRQQLLHDACRIAIEHGGFGIVWISRFDAESGKISPVAWGGLDNEWFAAHPQAGTFSGKGLIQRVLKEKRAVVCNDVVAETTPGGIIRAEAIRRGYRSLIVLPLIVDNKAVGTMSLYAGEAGFFTADEIRLLEELAADISFALQYLAREQQKTYLTYYDVLTGLPNRSLFLERVSLALRSAQPADGYFVLVLGDIRRFHLINDSLGRQSGDTVLKEVVKRLLALVRNPENLARIGADIFATFMPALHDLKELPHRIDLLVTEALRNPVVIDGQPLSLAFTAGAAVFPQDGTDAETLFRNAEAALKKAKDNGENYLFYTPEMNARVAESLVMESKLRRALELDQFVMFYQPKVDVRTRAVTGLEALIRWRDPELGLVPPIRFISILEESGLILDVGKWALEQVARDFRGWTSAGINVPRIAVNVSQIQLRHKDFIDTIVNVADTFDGRVVALDLEITESVFMDNMQAMVKKLQMARGLGFEIAVDDFGTGYSSLSYIAKLPVNVLKIDRSFVIAMSDSEYSHNIVTMIIQLAHTLHLKVVAEGVDDESHVRMLAELGCDQMQGYLISKPVPPEDVPAMLGSSPAQKTTD